MYPKIFCLLYFTSIKVDEVSSGSVNSGVLTKSAQIHRDMKKAVKIAELSISVIDCIVPLDTCCVTSGVVCSSTSGCWLSVACSSIIVYTRKSYEVSHISQLVLSHYHICPFIQRSFFVNLSAIISLVSRLTGISLIGEYVYVYCFVRSCTFLTRFLTDLLSVLFVRQPL